MMRLRRPLSLILLLFLAACAPVARDLPPQDPEDLPQIAGVLAGETVLAGEVVLAADVLVPAGSTLAIEPGTTVYVRPAEGTKIDPEYLSPLTELLVRGTITVRGSAGSPVRFIPLDVPEGNEVAWAGIVLDGATDSLIEGARIDGAETGIGCIASSPLIRNNRLSGCRYGIVAQKGSSPKILSNRIEKGEGGVFCWWGANPYLKGNRIADHEEEGVFVDRTSRPWLDRNEITGNAIGLALYAADLPYDANSVKGNGENVRLLAGGGRADE